MPGASQSLKIRAFYLMFWQLLVLISVAVIVVFVQSVQQGLSVFLGGLCYWLPTLFYAWRLFDYTGPRAATQFITAFFMGEVVKLFSSALLMVLLVKYLPVNFLSMLIGYVVAIVAFWLVCGWSLGVKQQ